MPCGAVVLESFGSGVLLGKVVTADNAMPVAESAAQRLVIVVDARIDHGNRLTLSGQTILGPNLIQTGPIGRKKQARLDRLKPQNSISPATTRHIHDHRSFGQISEDPHEEKTQCYSDSKRNSRVSQCVDIVGLANG